MNAGILSAASVSVVMPLAFTYGGFAQLLTGEFRKIYIYISFIVMIDSQHHSRPRLLQYNISLLTCRYIFTGFIQYDGINSWHGECGRSGPIMVPEEIHIVDALPKTRSGKIMRRVIKAAVQILRM